MNVPKSHSELYDLIQEKFGIGSWDEADPQVPWWKARGLEIAKLKATMRRRNLSIEDLVTAVWYAEREGIPVREVWQLCEQMTPARRALRKQQADMKPSLRDELNAAATLAYARGEEGWANRLYSSDLTTASKVLDLWHTHLERAR